MQKFDQYVYGKPVTVPSDHKPLQTIMNKALLDALKDCGKCSFNCKDMKSTWFTIQDQQCTWQMPFN